MEFVVNLHSTTITITTITSIAKYNFHREWRWLRPNETPFPAAIEVVHTVILLRRELFHWISIEAKMLNFFVNFSYNIILKLKRRTDECQNSPSTPWIHVTSIYYTLTLFLSRTNYFTRKISPSKFAQTMETERQNYPRFALIPFMTLLLLSFLPAFALHRTYTTFREWCIMLAIHTPYTFCIDALIKISAIFTRQRENVKLLQCELHIVWAERVCMCVWAYVQWMNKLHPHKRALCSVIWIEWNSAIQNRMAFLPCTFLLLLLVSP